MIIVITNPKPITNEHSIINQIFSNGLDVLHLRKKEFTELQLREYIEAIPKNYYSRIKLHSHYHLANEYGLRGIHTSSTAQQREGVVSKSFHSLEEIAKNRDVIEYGFLSPIFDSISKEGYKKEFDFEEIRDYLATCSQKIIALGGVDEDKIEILKELNFSGIALLGAIWQSENPIEKFIQIRERWN